MVAAEIHNMHMQLAFVQAGYGIGLLPARFIGRNLSVLRSTGGHGYPLRARKVQVISLTS